MKKSVFLAAGILALGYGTSNASTVLYLNFDEAADGVYTDDTAYTAGSSEVVGDFLLGSVDISYQAYDTPPSEGPEIGALPAGLGGSTAQGGKALLVDGSSGKEMGLVITPANPIQDSDITLEAIWWTNDAAADGNTVGIQSITGNEWPAGETAQFFIRTVGDERFDYWTDRGDSDGENVQITGAGSVVADTVYHDVLVFDLNESDPANSEIRAYRDGSLIGSSLYDASGNDVSYFGIGFNDGVVGEERRSMAVGMALSAVVNGTDDRGLRGGVDAVALSDAALQPSEFVLPSGNVVVPTQASSAWSLYE